MSTEQKYDDSLRRLEEAGLWPNPAGLELHVAFGPEDNMRVSEIWDSQEQFEAYGQQLMPILADVGIEFSGGPRSSRLITWSRASGTATPYETRYERGRPSVRPRRISLLCRYFATPRVGLEPTTLRLTAGCSAN